MQSYLRMLITNLHDAWIIVTGVTSHGLSCEVCKYKVHKRCSAKAINNCKWTTLASIGKDIIEDQDGVRICINASFAKRKTLLPLAWSHVNFFVAEHYNATSVDGGKFAGVLKMFYL